MKRVLFCALLVTLFVGWIYLLGTQSERESRAIEQILVESAAKTTAKLKADLEKLYGHPCMVGVTMQAYTLLKPGMSEIDARNIIGGEGVEQSSAGSIVTKCWQDKGRAIVLTFQDGKLVGKSQVGF